MALLTRIKEQFSLKGVPGRDASGIALFMVLSAVSVLSILVTEFTYIAQINQRIAYDGLDQVKAHYLAKSSLKLSLLRLKAYQTISGFANNKDNAALMPALPKGVLEQLWSFPFSYPIRADLPGLSMTEKDKITAFQKESSIDGRFSAFITSESGKYNLNMILAPFAPSPTPAPSGSPTPTPTPSASASPAFDAEAARKSLGDFLSQLIINRSETDEDFAYEYRDYKVDELVDKMVAWADPTYESNVQQSRDAPTPKQAPYYTITELHMIDGLDDTLYDMFAPSLTVSATPGINVNTMDEATTRALVPQMTKEETEEFFKFRDSTEEDNLFKKPEDFFKYLQDKVAAFRGSPAAVDKHKDDLQKRNVRVVTDETQFRIIAQGESNQAKRLIDVTLTLVKPETKKGGARPGAAPAKTSSFLIHFMRIL